MYIDPDSNVYLLSNVPLDSTYANTIYFSSKEAQESYFKSKLLYSNAPEDPRPFRFSKIQYIRISPTGENSFEAQIEPHNVDNIFKVNYIMVQNDIYQHKWFYGFVTSVNMKSNRNWQITFELDVMQTYLFDYDLKECFIERQHVSDDTIGKHTLPEPIDLGDYKAIQSFGTDTFLDYRVIMATSKSLEGTHAGIYGGMVSGLTYLNYPLTDNGIYQLTESLKIIEENGWEDSIASLYIMPNFYFTTGKSPVQHEITFTQRDNLDGYKPRNNKLYCYPFNLLYMHDSCGNGHELRFEDFTASTIKFKIYSVTSCNPEIVCVPLNYRGEGRAFNYKLVINAFPQIAYSIDTFKAWLAQNAGVTAIGLAGTLAGGALSGAAGNIGGVLSAGVGAASTIAGLVAKSNLAPSVRGNSGGSALIANNVLDFYFLQLCQKAEYLRMADDFLDKYGYSYMRLGVPHRNTRPQWNYIKTRDCTIVGSLPMDVANQICKIYDKGITFWKHANNVGNYSLNNTV